MREEVILYDGYCVLCTGLIPFILKRDKNHLFRFAAQQSQIGQRFLRDCAPNIDPQRTIVLISDRGCLVKSDAVLTILESLPTTRLLSLTLRLVPRSFRDRVYDLVAIYRYRIFGRRDVCWMTIPSYEDRFLTSSPATRADG